MTPFEEFLQKIVLKQVEGSVYLLPAVTIDQIESIKQKEKQAIINAYEMAIHDTINFDIDKDNNEEVSNISNQYYQETFKTPPNK